MKLCSSLVPCPTVDTPFSGETAAKTFVIGQVGPSRLRLWRNNMALQHLVKELGCLEKCFQIQPLMSPLVSITPLESKVPLHVP